MRNHEKSDKNAQNKSRQSTDRVRADREMLSRTGIVLILCGILAFLPVAGMFLNLMVFKHDEYAERALNNQTRSTAITASRGVIYDRNMNIMAASASVENVFLDPYELKRDQEDMDLISNTLASILDLDAAWIREQAADTSMRYKVLATRVEPEITDQIREFINKYDISGIHMEPNSRRYYPYGTLAAQVIGFTNSSNTGAEGIEAYYNNELEGIAGKVITTKGNYETEMPFSYEKYYEATDGNSIVLTIDTTVQYYLEKNMQAAIEKYDVSGGAFGLVMNCKTGEILAMATLGSYDPNNYLTIADSKVQERLDTLKQDYMLQKEGTEAYETALNAYKNALVNARLSQWRNRVVSDGYEPGSTFKIITMAAAIEEGTTTLGSTFFCGGAENIPGRQQTLHCWKAQGHGSEDASQALQNSCNIAFAHVALDLGGEKFYDYVKNFGLMERTGVDMSGEASGYFFQKHLLTDTATWGTSYLTSGSFGQTFKITPLQLVRAISAVVNGGYVLQPYIVSEVLDADGNILKKNETTVLRQAISAETSKTMCQMIESVVTDGTASNAQIAGYSIGGKTGTSEKTDVRDEQGNLVDTNDKIVSFVGIAPMDDPQYVVLVALDTPSASTGYVSGGVMAAPTVRGVLEDILPYLDVSRDYTDVDMSGVEMEMPSLTGYTESEAAAALEEQSLTYRIIGSGDKVTAQIPAAGMKLPGNSQVILYMGETPDTTRTAVPDFHNMTVSQANAAAANAGIYIMAAGTTNTGSDVFVTAQDIEAGTEVDRGTMVVVEFTDHSVEDN